MMEPIRKASIFNTALPAAEASLLAADIVPDNEPSYITINVCMSIAGILRVARTVAGVTTVENLNEAFPLVAGSAYAFSVEWRAGDSINLRYSTTAGTINSLRIDEEV